MRSTSETWDALFENAGGRLVCKAIINGAEYTDISAPVITRSAMQNAMSVGNVISASCVFTVKTNNVIPKSAQVEILAQYTDGETTSEWMTMGTFYISKRIKDPLNGLIALECYDSLLKANAKMIDTMPWTTEDNVPITDDNGTVIRFTGVWPRDMQSLLNDIAITIGIDIDSRTTINDGAIYTINMPSASATIRDVLSQIAAANAGNFIVTPENKLRLVPVVSAENAGSAVTNVVDIRTFTGTIAVGDERAVSGVQYTWGENTEPILIGDATGTVVSVVLPYAQASALYQAINGMTYLPYTITNAWYTPAAEIGDYIKYSDKFASVLWTEVCNYGLAFVGDVSAPDFAEIDDEFPYIGAAQKGMMDAKAYALEKVTEVVDDLAELSSQFASAVVDINSDITDLQEQIDGNITTWFYAVDPTLNNPPASEWTTDAERNNHLGDLYYNTTSGYCWRFMVSNNVYSWSRISDTDITTALANAQHAQDTADGKRRVFVSQPVPPYDVGDLWAQGTSGDILRCVTAKTSSGSYDSSDWARASKYTDDTAVTALDNSLNQQNIFNRLTNNGEEQGVILYNGKLYINASYINSGTMVADFIKGGYLTMGGSNNVNGSIKILDASGNTIGTWDKDGIKLYKGTIDGPSITLGGNNNADGVLTIKDSSGQTIGTWNNNGINATKGTFSGDITGATGTFSGEMSASGIKGGVLKLGGNNNVNGVFEMYDAQGVLKGQWDNSNLSATGSLALNGNSNSTLQFNMGDAGYFKVDQYRVEMLYSPNLNPIYVGFGNIPFGTSRVYYPIYVGNGVSAGDSYNRVTITPTSIAMKYGPHDYTATDVLSVNDYQFKYRGNDAIIYGNFHVYDGTKSRVVSTDQYADRLLYCYETPSPLFGDVGEGKIGEDGKCYVWLDPVFAQTITTTQYQVFLQRYGSGECWVSERKGSYFVVEGTPGMAFGWEIKAKQKDFDQLRLDRDDKPFTVPTQTYGADAAQYIRELQKGRVSV